VTGEIKMKRVWLLVIAVLFLLSGGCEFQHQDLLVQVVNDTGEYVARVELRSSVVMNPSYTQVFVAKVRDPKRKKLVFEMYGGQKVQVKWVEAKALQISYPCLDEPSYDYRVFHQLTSAFGVNVLYRRRVIETFEPTEADKKKSLNLVFENGDGSYTASLDMNRLSENAPDCLQQVFIRKTNNAGCDVKIFQIQAPPNDILLVWRNPRTLEISYPCSEKNPDAYKISSQKNRAFDVKIVYRRIVK